MSSRQNFSSTMLKKTTKGRSCPPWLDEDIQPLALTEKDIDDIVAFLASLTSDDYKKQGVKELARQRALSRNRTTAARHDAGVWPKTGPAQVTPAVTRLRRIVCVEQLQNIHASPIYRRLRHLTQLRDRMMS